MEQKYVQFSEGHLLDCADPSLVGDAVVRSISAPFLVLIWPLVSSDCFPKVNRMI